jgi:hypothetical protein
MPKRLVVNPFPSWNRPSQSYSPYSSTYIDVKTGSPDPVGFATNQLLIHWRVLALRSMLGDRLGGISHCDGKVRSYKNPPKSGGCGISGKVPWQIALWGPRYANVLVSNIARIATVSKVEAQSWQNPPNLDNQFLHRWMSYSRACHFKMADF